MVLILSTALRMSFKEIHADSECLACGEEQKRHFIWSYLSGDFQVKYLRPACVTSAYCRIGHSLEDTKIGAGAPCRSEVWQLQRLRG